MELEKLKKASEIVNKIRDYEYSLKTIQDIIKSGNYSDFVLYKCEESGMRCFETRLELPEHYVRGLIMSLNDTYKRNVQDLYKELDKI